jgi:hypothetical protein
MVMRAGGGAALEPLLIICRCRIRNSSSPWDNRVAGSPKRRTQSSVGVAQTQTTDDPVSYKSLCALVLISLPPRRLETWWFADVISAQ